VLIGLGAKVNNRHKGETSALLHAIRRQSVEIVRLLLDARADVNYADGRGETALFAAVAARAPAELLRLLLDRRAQVNCVGPNRRTPLALAIEKGNAEAFEALAEVPGVDWSFTDGVGRSFLHLAVEAGDVALVQAVLGHAGDGDCDPDLQDAEGDTALHLAARGASQEIILALMRAGCDPNKINRRRQNVFTSATEPNSAYISQLLLDQAISDALRRRRDRESQRQIEAEQQRRQDRKARTESLGRARSETPKRSPLSKGSRAKLATMTVQGGRVRSKADSASEKDTETRKPTEAKPWGGSKETELFQRQVRLGLRDLRQEVRKWLDDLENDINNLKKAVLGDLDDEDVDAE
jgi:ankyrin repeat protein